MSALVALAALVLAVETLFNQVYPSGILIRKERRTAVVRVHGNALKHGLTSDEVAYAWENPIRCRQRNGTDDARMTRRSGFRSARFPTVDLPS